MSCSEYPRLSKRLIAALIAGPETVMPSEFGSLDEANEILGLMMRHWNEIASTLFKDEVYVPLLE
jgi:uncharacterized protein